MKKSDTKVVFISKNFKSNLVIDLILKSNLKTLAIDLDLKKFYIIYIANKFIKIII